jgi:hypothetical protein
MTTEEEIQEAKKLKKPNYEIHNMFLSYCRSKGIGIYSKEVFSEILKLFPKNENPELYDYCIWMFNNQID